DEPDVSGGDVEDGGDRGGGVELLHGVCSPAVLVVSDFAKATLRSRITQHARCAQSASVQVNAQVSLQPFWF
ncbi:hypothetical protein, partial [Kitasatospora sp. NPDC050543]|uniref:hypothetical protein n=1 Tax=Kitasatospora sp. NPDC050543 TaxID=3364054 RepID=UPI003796B3F0